MQAMPELAVDASLFSTELAKQLVSIYDLCSQSREVSTNPILEKLSENNNTHRVRSIASDKTAMEAIASEFAAYLQPIFAEFVIGYTVADLIAFVKIFAFNSIWSVINGGCGISAGFNHESRKEKKKVPAAVTAFKRAFFGRQLPQITQHQSAVNYVFYTEPGYYIKKGSVLLDVTRDYPLCLVGKESRLNMNSYRQLPPTEVVGYWAHVCVNKSVKSLFQSSRKVVKHNKRLLSALVSALQNNEAFINICTETGHGRLFFLSTQLATRLLPLYIIKKKKIVCKEVKGINVNSIIRSLVEETANDHIAKSSTTSQVLDALGPQMSVKVEQSDESQTQKDDYLIGSPSPRDRRARPKHHATEVNTLSPRL